jgi:UDP-glucose 4-epimerase
MINNKKILVVGGAGYIGSHVVKALKEVGYSPVVFDNLSTGLKQNLFPDCEFILGDILNYAEIKGAMAGVGAVIHLAALKAAGDSMLVPEKYAVNNVSGTINLLNAVSEAGIKKIIFSSSAAVYGSPKYLPLDEKHPTNPENFYGYTKLAVEELLSWYSKLKGIKFVALRYFNAVGYDASLAITGEEKNPGNLLPIIMEAVVGRRPKVTVFGTDYETADGSGVRDYIHVTDLAQAHLQSLEYLETHDSLTVNLGTTKGISVLEMIKAAKEMSGVDFPVELGARRPGDPGTVLADASLAKQVLNWEPKYSDLENIIKTTLSVYKKNNK